MSRAMTLDFNRLTDDDYEWLVDNTNAYFGTSDLDIGEEPYVVIWEDMEGTERYNEILTRVEYCVKESDEEDNDCR